MNTGVMFSSKSDEWETPQELFRSLHAEFNFEIDLACTAANCLCRDGFFLGDSLEAEWAFQHERGFCNPPYSRGLQAKFIAKAAEERRRGFLTVMLLPARTDTRMFHAHIWDATKHRPRKGVEVRFLPGRLKFSGCKDAAPFPSMVTVFRP